MDVGAVTHQSIGLAGENGTHEEGYDIDALGKGKGKGKSGFPKGPCYKCGHMGHIAAECKTEVVHQG